MIVSSDYTHSFRSKKILCARKKDLPKLTPSDWPLATCVSPRAILSSAQYASVAEWLYHLLIIVILIDDRAFAFLTVHRLNLMRILKKRFPFKWKKGKQLEEVVLVVDQPPRAMHHNIHEDTTVDAHHDKHDKDGGMNHPTTTPIGNRSRTPICRGCLQSFSWFRHRHECQLCHGMVCRTCHMRMFVHYTTTVPRGHLNPKCKVRVCAMCISTYSGFKERRMTVDEDFSMDALTLLRGNTLIPSSSAQDVASSSSYCPPRATSATVHEQTTLLSDADMRNSLWWWLYIYISKKTIARATW